MNEEMHACMQDEQASDCIDEQTMNNKSLNAGSSASKQALTSLIKERVLYCIHHHRSLDVASSMQQELGLLTELVTAGVTADATAWQSQMLLLFQLLLPATGTSTCCPSLHL